MFEEPAERPMWEMLCMPQSQQESLTWDEAEKYTARDSLSMARWDGLKASGKYKPCEAAKIMNRLVKDYFRKPTP